MLEIDEGFLVGIGCHRTGADRAIAGKRAGNVSFHAEIVPAAAGQVCRGGEIGLG